MPLVQSASPKLAPPGFVHSAIAGRTDHIPIHVPGGSYVLPADHVNHLGQGNSLAGGKVLDAMFKIHPAHAGKFADGGATGAPTPIIVAGGEYILHPDQVRMVGHGNLKSGHDALDHWVKATRKNHIATLKKLPGPKQ